MTLQDPVDDRSARQQAAVAAWTRQAELLAALVDAETTSREERMTVSSPRFPGPGDPRSTWFSVFFGVVVFAWTAQSMLAGVGLWSAGRGQPSVVMRRMEALSLGGVVLTLALVATFGSHGEVTPVRVGATLLSVGGATLLALAFMVPPWLAAAWRAPDLGRLAVAERSLMAAVTPEEVAAAAVPAVVQLFGANGAALLDGHGRTTAALGTDAEELAGVRAELAQLTGDAVVVRTGDGGFACRLSEGWLVVRPGPFAPVFSEPELHLLDRVGSFVDLALQRCRLFEEHARARRTTEAANTELQTLIYTVSHDLRNPIISVLGYLDVLGREHAGQLTGDGEHYLQRIQVNALYMRFLARSVLESSGVHVVAEAADGPEALTAFRKLDPPPVPTVILLDNQMPGPSGLEVAQEMLAHAPDQLIVLFSAYLSPEVIEQAERIGVAACVSKVDVTRLASIIRELVEARAS